MLVLTNTTPETIAGMLKSFIKMHCLTEDNKNNVGEQDPTSKLSILKLVKQAISRRGLCTNTEALSVLKTHPYFHFGYKQVWIIYCISITVRKATPFK